METRKSIAKSFLSVFTVICIVFGLTSVIEAKAASIPMLSKTKKNIYVGSTFQLKLENASGSVSWSSSDEDVAQVLNNGLVIGMAKGDAVITAINGGYKYNCSVKVLRPSLNKKKVTLIKGKTLNLKLKGDTAVSWRSSDKYVASVSKTGTVKAVGLGSAKIKVRGESGSEYSCTVIVNNPALFVGDVIEIGKWEQDNNSFNGEEPIEWEVLAVDADKALLISKKILFEKAYESVKSESYWEECELRKWLNNDVYEVAFSSQEKSRIVKSIVTADSNPENINSKQGKATEDFLFCLSVQEVYNYNANKACSPVPVIAGTNYWWTRSIDGSYWGTDCAGRFWGNSYKSEHIDSKAGVRPAMWIKMD